MNKVLMIAAVPVLLLPIASKAQVKIGGTPGTIDAASILELEAPDKALYMVRVSLTSTDDKVTVPNPKAGMVVYNTNATITTGGTPPYPANGIGLYYFDGTGWVSTGNHPLNSAGSGLTYNIATDSIDLGGVLTTDAIIDGTVNKKTVEITGDNNIASDGVLSILNTVTGTPSDDQSASFSQMEYTGAAAGVGTAAQEVVGSTARSLSTNDGFQAVGSESLGEWGTVSSTAPNGIMAIGGHGLGSANGIPSGDSAIVIGLSGGTSFPNGSTNWNGVGIDGYLNFNNTTDGAGAAGHFDANGAATSFGVIGSAGDEKLYQTLFDGNLTGSHIGVAAVNHTPNPTTKDLALYTEGQSYMNGNVRVKGNDTVNGNFTVNSGNVRINGNDTVVGNLTISSGNVRVNGNIDTVTGNTIVNTLTAYGLPKGNSADSILSITSSGIVRKIGSPTNLAGNGLTYNAATDSIDLGGVLTSDAIINGTANKKTVEIYGDNNVASDGVLDIYNNITGTPSDDQSASFSQTEYTGTASGTGIADQEVVGSTARSLSTNGDFQSVGSEMLGEWGTGSSAAPNGIMAIGGHGLGSANGVAPAKSQAVVIGLSGGTSFPNGSNNWNGVGIDGYLNFNNTTDGAGVAGHFDATGAETSFGVIGSAGDNSLYQTLFDPAFKSMHIGIAAVNHTASPDTTNLALYAEGRTYLNGSVTVKADTNNTAGTIAPTDYYVVLKSTSNLVLPGHNASNRVGRMLIITNKSGGTRTIQTAASPLLYSAAGSVIGTIGDKETISMIFDGTDWHATK